MPKLHQLTSQNESISPSQKLKTLKNDKEAASSKVKQKEKLLKLLDDLHDEKVRIEEEIAGWSWQNEYKILGGPVCDTLDEAENEEPKFAFIKKIKKKLSKDRLISRLKSKRIKRHYKAYRNDYFVEDKESHSYLGSCNAHLNVFIEEKKKSFSNLRKSSINSVCSQEEKKQFISETYDYNYSKKDLALPVHKKNKCPILPNEGVDTASNKLTYNTVSRKFKQKVPKRHRPVTFINGVIFDRSDIEDEVNLVSDSGIGIPKNIPIEVENVIQWKQAPHRPLRDVSVLIKDTNTDYRNLTTIVNEMQKKFEF